MYILNSYIPPSSPPPHFIVFSLEACMCDHVPTCKILFLACFSPPPAFPLVHLYSPTPSPSVFFVCKRSHLCCLLSEAPSLHLVICCACCVFVLDAAAFVFFSFFCFVVYYLCICELLCIVHVISGVEKGNTEVLCLSSSFFSFPSQVV